MPECCNPDAPGQEKMPELPDRLETGILSGLMQLSVPRSGCECLALPASSTLFTCNFTSIFCKMTAMNSMVSCLGIP